MTSVHCSLPDIPAPVVIATYCLRTQASDLQKAAANIAVGQTVGTWGGVETQGLENYLARVVSVEELPQTADIAPYRDALIRVAFPLITVESDIGTLLTVLFGKLSMAGAIRLEDVEVPPELDANLPGPRFGIQGVRELTGVSDGPLLMSIFKPCLGLSPGRLAELFYETAVGGANLVKDDEILSDPNFDSARRRLASCLEAGERARRETGKTTLYAINLTGPADKLIQRAETLVSDGANAILFNYLSYGLPMLAALRNNPTINVPLVAHPSLAGAFYGSPNHGISPKVIFGRLPRLAGADLVLFPSPYGSVALPMADALAVSKVLRADQAAWKPSFPVPSAGITREMVSDICRDFGPDTVINAGTGIHDHPDGSRAGARAFAQEMEACLAAVKG